jgi:hypothetical protein
MRSVYAQKSSSIYPTHPLPHPRLHSRLYPRLHPRLHPPRTSSMKRECTDESERHDKSEEKDTEPPSQHSQGWAGKGAVHMPSPVYGCCAVSSRAHDGLRVLPTPENAAHGALHEGSCQRADTPIMHVYWGVFLRNNIAFWGQTDRHAPYQSVKRVAVRFHCSARYAIGECPWITRDQAARKRIFYRDRINMHFSRF